MAFKVAEKFSIVLSKGSNDYKFELYIFDTLIPVIMTPADQITSLENKLSFNFNIRYENIIMEVGKYKVELSKQPENNNFNELNLFKDGKLVFNSQIDSAFENDMVKATFTVRGNGSKLSGTFH